MGIENKNFEYFLKYSHWKKMFIVKNMQNLILNNFPIACLYQKSSVMPVSKEKQVPWTWLASLASLDQPPNE